MPRRAPERRYKFRPEAGLLLASAATGPEAPPPDALLPFITPDFDWPWFTETARVHAVLPLVHRRLLAAGVDRPELRQQATGVALRNLRLTTELVALARAFEGRGIRLLAWKGPALAMRAWGEVTVREFRDLDLVVFPEELADAMEVLQELGYRADREHSGVRLRTLVRHRSDIIYRHRGEGHRVELHWRLTPGRFATGLPISRLWTNRQPVPVGSGIVSAPGDDDVLLALAEHGTRHTWERLGWIIDIDRLSQDSTIDWDSLLQSARDIGHERMILLAMRLLGHLLGRVLPDPVRHRLDYHPSIPRLLAYVATRLLPDQRVLLGMGERTAFRLQARERVKDRLRILAGLGLGIGERDWEVVDLPDLLHPLYYALRPLRLVRRFGVGFLATLLRR